MGRAAVPVGRVHRLARGDRAARRRQDAATSARACCKAVEHINTEISEAVLGLDASEQAFLDQTLIDLDGTDNKSRLGANAMLAVSRWPWRAPRPRNRGLPLYRYFGGMGGMQLPVPMMNVINGGAHANNNLDLQEFMIIPVGAPSFREAVRYGAEVFHALKKIIDDKGMPHRRRRRRRLRAQRRQPRSGDPADPARRSTRPATRAGEQIALGLDCAASEFYKDGKYQLEGEGLALIAPRVDRHAGDLGRQVPDHQHRGRHGTKATGTAGST